MNIFNYFVDLYKITISKGSTYLFLIFNTNGTRKPGRYW